MTKKSTKKPPEKYWKAMVGVWIRVYGELVPPVDGQVAKPSFVGAETVHLKSLVAELRSRAEASGVEWTEDEAKKRLENFLRYAYNDNFIRANFMLRIISNNRTKIFNRQIKINGINSGRTEQTPVVKNKSKADFGNL